MNTKHMNTKHIDRQLIAEAIKYWKNVLAEADRLNDINVACQFFNDYAKNNGYALQTATGKKFTSVRAAFADYYEWFSNEHQDEIRENVIDDAEHRGVTWHDDSDMDREYGYGPYGWWDDDEIDAEVSKDIEEMTDAAFDDIARCYQEFSASGSADYSEWCAANNSITDDGDPIIGFGWDGNEPVMWLKKDRPA